MYKIAIKNNENKRIKWFLNAKQYLTRSRWLEVRIQKPTPPPYPNLPCRVSNNDVEDAYPIK